MPGHFPSIIANYREDMSRALLLAVVMLGLTSVHASASEPPASAATPEPATEFSPRAPRDTDRPEPRDICERQNGLRSIHGRGGDDRIYGGSFAYRMFGDEGRDFLLGGSADDEIIGGDDADVLIGGGGADLFVYDTKFSSLPDNKGRWSAKWGDTIVDFRDVDRDKIDLTRMEKYGRDAPRTFPWSGTIPQGYSVWLTPRSGDTVVAVDLDGDAQADFAIRLLGDVRLTESDFCGVDSSEH